MTTNYGGNRDPWVPVPHSEQYPTQPGATFRPGPAYGPLWQSAAPGPAPARQPGPRPEPWWTREGMVARVLAITGSVVTLIGVVMLVVLAIQEGILGPQARVLGAGALAVAFLITAQVLHSRGQGGIPVTALAGVGFATALVDIAAATVLYDWFDNRVGLALALGVTLLGLALARYWEAQALAVILTVGTSLGVPAVAGGYNLAALLFMLIVYLVAAVVGTHRRWPVLVGARAIPLALGICVDPLAGSHTSPELLVVAAIAALAGLGVSQLARRIERISLPSLVELVAVILAFLAAQAGVQEGHWSSLGLVALSALLAGLAYLWRDTEAHAVTAAVLAGLAGMAAVLTWEVHEWQLVGVEAVVVITVLALRQIQSRAAWCVGAIGVAINLLFTASVVAGVLGEPASVSGHGAVGAASLTLVGLALYLAWPMLRGVFNLPLSVALGVGVAIASAVLIFSGSALGELADLKAAQTGANIASAAVTVAWVILAGYLILRSPAQGPAAQGPAARTTGLGLGLLAMALGRLLLIDIAYLPAVYRMLIFLVIGVAIMGVGIYYAKQRGQAVHGAGGGGNGIIR